MDYIKAFVTGGVLCVIGQILLDRTKLTPARICVLFVSSGVVLTAVGIYPKIVEFGGAGATVPLAGFGYALANGVTRGIEQFGFAGILSGGLAATATGVAAAMLFGYLAALLFKPKTK